MSESQSVNEVSHESASSPAISVDNGSTTDDTASRSSSTRPSKLNMSLNASSKNGIVVPNRVFVGGIDANISEEELSEFFSRYGTVKAVKIINDRTGVPKGYGFVTFETDDDAQRVISEKDNLMLKDKKLNVAGAVKKQININRYDFGNILHQPNGAILYQPFQLAAPTTFNDAASMYYPEGLPLYPIQFAVPSGQPHLNANMNGLTGYHPQATMPCQGPNVYYAAQPSYVSNMPSPIQTASTPIAQWNGNQMRWQGLSQNSQIPSNAAIMPISSALQASYSQQANTYHNSMSPPSEGGHRGMITPPNVQSLPQTPIYAFPTSNSCQYDNSMAQLIPSLQNLSFCTSKDPNMPIDASSQHHYLMDVNASQAGNMNMSGSGVVVANQPQVQNNEVSCGKSGYKNAQSNNYNKSTAPSQHGGNNGQQQSNNHSQMKPNVKNSSYAGGDRNSSGKARYNGPSNAANVTGNPISNANPRPRCNSYPHPSSSSVTSSRKTSGNHGSTSRGGNGNGHNNNGHRNQMAGGVASCITECDEADLTGKPVNYVTSVKHASYTPQASQYNAIIQQQQQPMSVYVHPVMQAHPHVPQQQYQPAMSNNMSKHLPSQIMKYVNGVPIYTAIYANNAGPVDGVMLDASQYNHINNIPPTPPHTPSNANVYQQHKQH